MFDIDMIIKEVEENEREMKEKMESDLDYLRDLFEVKRTSKEGSY